MKKQKALTQSSIEQKKTSPKWFYLILFLIPIFFFLLTEISLRVFKYGRDNRQWIEVTDGKLILNYYISARYFSTSGIAPVVLSNSFDKIKKENSFRVFILGESSAAGYPYLPNGSFSNYICDRLQLLYPEKTIEVINTGITATCSYTWIDLIDGIIEQKPDLIIIYGGHNEYYGAMGAASDEIFRSSRFFNKSRLWLNQLKIAELTVDFINWISSRFSDTKQKTTGTLMAIMAKGRYVPLNSNIYNEGLTQFEANMRELFQKTSGNKIPVILGLPASNLKDQSPFVSQPVPGLKTADEVFKIASDLLQNGNTRKADSLFRLAKDLDLLKFRAPEEIKKIILKLAGEFSYPVVNIDSLLCSASASKISGDEIMTDHLHPTLQGYQLMGKIFFEEMSKYKLLPSGNPAAISEKLQDSIVKANYNFSRLDSLIAAFRIWVLKNDWPYIDSIKIKKKDIVLSNLIDSVAYGVAVSKISWESAHQAAALWHLSRNDFASFKKEYNALIYTFPHKPEYSKFCIQTLLHFRKYDEAFPYLLNQFKNYPDTFSSKWLGIILMMKEETTKALSYLEFSNGLDNHDTEMLYFLSVANGRLKNFRKSIEYVNRWLELEPQNKRAKYLLGEFWNELQKQNGLANKN